MEGISLKALTVDFHEPGFVSKRAQEHQVAPWFQLSDDEKQQLGRSWGPANPQALNRYAVARNNPLRYTDPTGHSDCDPADSGPGGPCTIGGGGTPPPPPGGGPGWLARLRAWGQRAWQQLTGQGKGQAEAAAPASAATSTLGSRVASEGRLVRGDFPRTADANEILYRVDASGKITHYQVYGPDGLPVMRVDITGRAHGGVPTPHVVEFQRNVAPDDTVYVQPSRIVRPAQPDELP
jgi:hypothetical protein